MSAAPEKRSGGGGARARARVQAARRRAAHAGHGDVRKERPALALVATPSRSSERRRRPTAGARTRRPRRRPRARAARGRRRGSHTGAPRPQLGTPRRPPSRPRADRVGPPAISRQPRKHSVTCSASCRTGAQLCQIPRAGSRCQSRDRARGPARAGRARRTGAPAVAHVRAGSASPPAPVEVRLAEQQAAEHVHGDRDRALANVLAPARAAAPSASAARPRAMATDRHTVPDRLLRGPPVGAGDAGDPDSRARAPKRSIAPSASIAATSVDTAPKRSISSSGTPASVALGLVRVDDQAAEHVRRGPGAIGEPRREQAARARLGRGDRAAAAAAPATCSSIVEPSVEKIVSAWRCGDRGGEARRRPPASAGAVGRRDLDLRAAQAGRDLQRLEVHPLLLERAQRRRDLGLRDPEQPQDPLPVLAARRRPRPGTRRSPIAVRHIGWSSRGGPGSTTTVGPGAPSRGRHDQPRRRPDRLDAPSRPPGSPPACGCDARIASSSRFGQRSRSGARISQMRPSSASSSTIARPGELADHLGGEVVGRRPEAAAGDQPARRPRPARKRSTACMSSRRSPTITMCARSIPSSRSRSLSHGPLRSEMIPVRTSVPVTTIPARGRYWHRAGPVPSGSSSRALPAGTVVADRVARGRGRRCSCR